MKKRTTDKTTFKEFPSLLLKGFLMGSADVIPGVSGGTMALILGIYNRLLDAIKSADLQTLKLLFTFRIADIFRKIHWKFLLGLLSGMFAAILFFTRIVPLPEIMYTHPEPIFGLYFGLILGSIFLLIKSLKQIDGSSLIFIILGTAIGWWVVNLVPTQTPENYLFIFFSGAIAICAMILPGISGSFILLVLGKYQFILGQFGKIGTDETASAILILVVFVIGMILGIALFSRLLSWFLSKYHKATLCVLIGFFIGSLSVIWPYQNRVYEPFIKEQKVSYLDAKAQKVLHQADQSHKPEYERIQSILNEELTEAQRVVVIEKVSMKLVKSEPFWPSWSGAETDQRLKDGLFGLIGGAVSMLLGLVLLIGIEKLADKDAY